MKGFIEKDLFLGTMNELIDEIVSNTEEKTKKAYFAINSDCMLKYWKHQGYKKLIDSKSNLVYVDGMGVIFSQRILNLPVCQERIATTDLFPALTKYLNATNKNIRIFLLGGRGDTAGRVRTNFKKAYPNVEIVGTHHGFFNKCDNSIIKEINSLNVDILFVGFGTPLQEQWVHENFNKLEVTTFITCGGLFDYYSENVKRAPISMQKAGLEWLFRLMQEPKRLYKRYIFGNVNFVFSIARMRLSKK